MEKKNIIYGLRDPRNDVYYYIGKTTVGVDRPLSHLTESHSVNVNEWVENIRSNGIQPKIDIIEEVTDINELTIREKYWIDYYYHINNELLNIQCLPKEIGEMRSDVTDSEFDKLTDIIDKVPTILRRERLMRGISQTELSEMTGMSRSTISLVEKGVNVTYNSMVLYKNAITSIERVSDIHTQRVRKKKLD